MLPFRPMMRPLLPILMFLVTFQTFASARGFFISPSGNDANSGTSQGAPWKTFAHAIPLLNPGDTLNLMDGIYTFAANGSFFADCNATTNPAHNGTATQPITIQAVNERQAWINGDGSADSFTVNNCSYWQIIGIHASSADNNSTLGCSGFACNGRPFSFSKFQNGLIRRNLADHVNRYCNCSALVVDNVSSGSTNNIIEENEVYYFHRHGIIVKYGQNNEIRRNYANPRDYEASAPPGSYPSGVVFGISSYPANNNLYENNISENISGASSAFLPFMNIGATGVTWLGNVALNSTYGFQLYENAPPDAASGQSNATLINNVVINPKYTGFWNRAGYGTFNHDSAFGTSATSAGLFQFDKPTGINYPTYQQSVKNSTAQGATTSSNGGFFIQSGVPGVTFSYDHNNCYNNRICYNPNYNITNAKSSDPAFGGCYLWVPASSPLHGAASDGGDIGANILYQYVNGSLTTTRLWDPSTGAPLFKGATAMGLNDVAGSSLFDVANRLNINKNGCSFPVGYASDANELNSPTALTAIVH